MASAIPQGRTTVAETGLKAGALKLPSIFMQSLTMVAPGIAALFYTPVVVNQAGLAAPLAYPIAFIIVLLTAIVLAHLARAVPSAGGYYTYVSRGIHPRVGFLVSWLNIIYAPLVLGAVTVFGGYVISSSLGWNGVVGDWFRSASVSSPSRSSRASSGWASRCRARPWSSPAGSSSSSCRSSAYGVWRAPARAG